MKIHRIRTFTLGSGIAIGLVMLALSPSPSVAQTHPRHHAPHRCSPGLPATGLLLAPRNTRKRPQ
jgi:hypothetical protein